MRTFQETIYYLSILRPHLIFFIFFFNSVLFERILLPNPEDFVIPNTKITSQVVEKKIIKYLYDSYARNFNRTRNANDSILSDCSDKIKELILRNFSTAIKQQDLFEGQNLPNQLVDIVKNIDIDDVEILSEFLSSFVKDIMQDAEEATENFQLLEAFFNPIFMLALKKTKSSSLVSLDKWILHFLAIFVSDKTNSHLAELLLNFTTPKQQQSNEGVKYSESLLGSLLCLSIMPKNANGPYEYFDNPQNLTSISSLTSSLWDYLKQHLDTMHQLFKGFLLCGGEVRSKVLIWICDCLHANVARGQIWNTHTHSPLQNLTTAPDSFMIGLAGVLLRLCQPLFKPQLKVMNVDPSYCAVKDKEKFNAGVHMREIEKETCLLPTSEDEQRLTAEKYNFISECFFMTHKAIDLSK
jgi:ubiquitin conjugation factor E4 A